MKTLITAVSLALCLFVVSPVLATSQPEPNWVTPVAGVTINATASVSYGPLPWPYPAVAGAAALDIECIAPAAGVADVQIEVLASSGVNSDTAVSCYSGTTNKSILSASSLTDFGAEGEWILAIPMCTSAGLFVKITGVNSNPADTVCKVVIFVQ